MNTHFSRLRGPTLVCNVWGHLGDDVHEGVLSHVEGLEPQFIIPSAKDDLFPPVGASGVCPDPALHGVEVVPEHPAFMASKIPSMSLSTRTLEAKSWMLGGHRCRGRTDGSVCVGMKAHSRAFCCYIRFGRPCMMYCILW